MRRLVGEGGSHLRDLHAQIVKVRHRVASVALAAIMTTAGAVAASAQSAAPRSVRMTWFGITNWHYQIGDLGIMLDGAVSFRSSGTIAVKQQINRELVDKVADALGKQG